MKQIPFVGQKFDYDCGPASATMVARALGYPVNLEEMTRLCGTSSKYGTSPAAMVDGLQKAGLKATLHDKLLKQDLISLLDKDCMIILDYWDYSEGHYVVLSDIIDNSDGTSQVVVLDPAYDLDKDDPDPTISLDWDDFYTNWFDYEVDGNNRTFTDRLAIVIEKMPKKALKTRINAK